MDFNLELGLSTSSTSASSAASTISTQSNNNGDNSKRQQMTIFYNGGICVSDVTEAQARSIISEASRKTAEGMCTSQATGKADPVVPILQSQQQFCTKSQIGVSMKKKSLPQNGLSMKRSLQQFLEKRKHRIQATSPYHH